ncbi:hypothetical protein [Paraglaciecola sp.]|uniref:hypothetical protein n=1 Tax=Paraglaciecola sp. TaxID=1920173 RepID=UPI003266F0D9
MGSRISLSEGSLNHELKKTEQYLPEESQKRLIRDIDIVITEGKLGFNLLMETVFLLIASGGILIVSGIILYPRKASQQ